MPTEFLDEELVMCMVFYVIDVANSTWNDGKRRRYSFDWILYVQERKPKLLTEAIYVVAARLVAKDFFEVFLNITPKKYRTKDFYFELTQGEDGHSIHEIAMALHRENWQN